ncbi:hypothetical protein ACSSS7_001301 [Eimeria intestinalis]
MQNKKYQYKYQYLTYFVIYILIGRKQKQGDGWLQQQPPAPAAAVPGVFKQLEEGEWVYSSSSRKSDSFFLLSIHPSSCSNSRKMGRVIRCKSIDCSSSSSSSNNSSRPPPHSRSSSK